MSQLLARLQQELAAAKAPIERAQIVAKIAACLARIGRFDEAKSIIQDLRGQFGQGQSGVVTVWLMLAEGLVQHYQNLSPSALDRINRALLLGRGMGYETIVALASAWKAHIEFEKSDFDAMAESLRVAISNVKVNESDAQTRIAIVLTNSFTICGDDRQSRLWFKRGHEHAVKNGDQASIDALLYNRAAFSLAWHRALACIEPIPDEALRRLRSEVDSARNLQNLTGISALGVHIRLLDARLLMLEKRYEDAAKALQAVRGDGPFGEHNFSQTFVDLEMALCNLRGGCVPTMPSLPALEALDRLDIDERIVAMWLLLQLTESGRSMAPWPDCSERLNALWLKYSQGRAELRQKLIEFEAG